MVQTTIVQAYLERYIRPMISEAGGLIDILEIAMETCCKQHNLCHDCLHLDSCIKLWDKASEQSINKDLTPRQLKDYIEEFNEFWETRPEIIQPAPELNN